ncbi:hypothetical protein LCGC14_1583110, partial [marine sediment metagenome]
YTQYIRTGNVYRPSGPGTFHEKLTRQAYRLKRGMNGLEFHRAKAKTDELYRFENSIMESVIKEIDRFWDLKEEYSKFGVMHNRGILLEGPPGTGKSSVIQQIVEMMVQRGDVVFFSASISLVKEALHAFKEVEEERAVVVVLEDADEHIKYEQNSFLQLLDGDEAVEGVLYLATTNYVENFPARLRRPGRFDKIVHVGPPPYEGRFVYLKNKVGKVETDEEIARLAKLTHGLSFGHLRELVTAAYALKEPKADVLKRITSKIHGGVVESKDKTTRVNNARPSESIVTITVASEKMYDKVSDAVHKMAQFAGLCVNQDEDNKGHYNLTIRVSVGEANAARNLVMKALEDDNIIVQDLTVEAEEAYGDSGYNFTPSTRAQRMPAKDAAAAQATSAGPVLRSRSAAGSSKANEKGKRKKGNKDPFSKIWREGNDDQTALDKASSDPGFRKYVKAVQAHTRTAGHRGRIEPIKIAPYFNANYDELVAAGRIIGRKYNPQTKSLETAPDDTPFSRHGATRGPAGAPFQTDAKLPYKQWVKQVDREVDRKGGMSIHDLPDVPLADWHEDGMSPKAAAAKAIKMAKESTTEADTSLDATILKDLKRYAKQGATAAAVHKAVDSATKDRKVSEKEVKKALKKLVQDKLVWSEKVEKWVYYMITPKGLQRAESTTETKFRAKWDFAKASPANWAGSNQARTFGKDNEGFVISAPDEKAAKEILKKKHRVNPFYVKLTKESVGERRLLDPIDRTGEISVATINRLRKKIAKKAKSQSRKVRDGSTAHGSRSKSNVPNKHFRNNENPDAVVDKTKQQALSLKKRGYADE